MEDGRIIREVASGSAFSPISGQDRRAQTFGLSDIYLLDMLWRLPAPVTSPGLRIA